MKNHLSDIMKDLKKEFNIDCRKDVHLQNSLGLSPIMTYAKGKAIVAKANELIAEKGLKRLYNMEMETEKLREESLHSYLKGLVLKLEEWLELSQSNIKK